MGHGECPYQHLSFGFHKDSQDIMVLVDDIITVSVSGFSLLIIIVWMVISAEFNFVK